MKKFSILHSDSSTSNETLDTLDIEVNVCEISKELLTSRPIHCVLLQCITFCESFVKYWWWLRQCWHGS